MPNPGMKYVLLDNWMMKQLLRKCPHHGIPYCIQLETFYNGLNVVARQMLDATAGGAFTACTYNEGFDILEKISNNNGQWSDPRAMPLKKTTGMNEVDVVSALTAQITKLISNLTSSPHMQSDANTFNPNVQSVQCVYSGEGHSFEHCPRNPEHVNYVNKTGPFSQTYNPGWRNHPNFSWHSPALNPSMQKPQGQSNFQLQEQSNFQQEGQSNFHSQAHQGNHNNQHANFQNHQSSFQSKPKQQAESSTSLEAMMKGFITQNQASIKNLKTQMGQMALEIRKRPVGSLPSDTKIPQREGKEHVKEDFKELETPQDSATFEVLESEDRKTLVPSLDVAPNLELKQLSSQLKYAFLRDSGKLPVIISSSLEANQEEKLVDMLKLRTKAIGWTIADLKGISPTICQHKIILEDKSFTSVEPQRRLNPVMNEVVKKEILKWLDAGIIYPIASSTCVTPVQCVPKKGGVTVVPNEKNELIPTRTVIGWRICMDYRRPNKATQKDHFPLPFIDQMLDRLAEKEFYYFLDGYSGYNQISIAPDDQEKTTFTCPYGTFAFRRMPFGLCNAPATFQRCMMSIFSDMLEHSMEIFMDDFSVYGTSYDLCLQNLEKSLQRCEETDLVFNWEKCHFMIKEGIVLGHLISKRGIEVDKAKLEVIEKLPEPTTVKGIRSFLGHTGFYRRFIKDFS
ncbi:uncharacterized protein LOC112499837, partial [Cynara cardunculus var. scolymus]|uniref:uncharacterized protein LOC112499837 n=1 Tax=Cynara cardunculus var. scolymus TaxID=59895 RepID=UPI000D62CCA3